MKLRHPWLIRAAGFLGAGVVRLLMSTVRYQFHFGVPVDPNDRHLRGRYIYAFWHEAMLFGAGRKTRARFQVLIGQHADGELIAQISRRVGFRVVRGSSTRGGVEAVRKMLRLGRGHLVVTPDGPRGPRRRVQAGIVYLASRTGLPIVPAGIGFENAWRARSWDRFAVPKPGSRAALVVNEVIAVPPDIDKEGLEFYRQRVEHALLAATAEAERWAESGIRSQESGVRSQESGVRSQESEVRGQQGEIRMAS
jgi:lysophospholipid acyltransferase (LPLAT)-like uncharacterized protein